MNKEEIIKYCLTLEIHINIVLFQIILKASINKVKYKQLYNYNSTYEKNKLYVVKQK